MVDRTKQPEGCIEISERCVFYTKKFGCRVATEPKRFIRAIVV